MNLSIVHLLKAARKLLLGVELQVAIAARSTCFSVEYDLTLSNLEASVFEELLEIEIVEVFLGEVGNVKRGELIHDLLALLLVDMVASLAVASNAHVLYLLNNSLLMNWRVLVHTHWASGNHIIVRTGSANRNLLRNHAHHLRVHSGSYHYHLLGVNGDTLGNLSWDHFLFSTKFCANRYG